MTFASHAWSGGREETLRSFPMEEGRPAATSVCTWCGTHPAARSPGSYPGQLHVPDTGLTGCQIAWVLSRAVGSWCCGDFVTNFIIKSSLPFLVPWCHTLLGKGEGGDTEKVGRSNQDPGRQCRRLGLLQALTFLHSLMYSFIHSSTHMCV